MHRLGFGVEGITQKPELHIPFVSVLAILRLYVYTYIYIYTHTHLSVYIYIYVCVYI